ncbi:hypothetical protein PKF05_10105, partial [Fusobacterium simiae]|uniref:hypothetical protein n=1 Tax=Fusobacterium simiae TaxID=855 RepID=UPI0020C4E6B3|nr:hypothetical protein [Fusobacterium simiae]MDC7956178.1 hypothetical protein [Fusobacterium simiae]
MNNTNIENVALKFVILLILEYDVCRTLATEYIGLRPVISSLVKYSLFCIIVLLSIIYRLKSSSVRHNVLSSSGYRGLAKKNKDFQNQTS